MPSVGSRLSYGQNGIIERRRQSDDSDLTTMMAQTGCRQLQACNVLLSLLGAIGLGLAGTQFQPRIGIDNYRQIDLRLSASLLCTLTGTVGFFCVGRSSGNVLLKTLYTLTVLFALCTAVFYGFTTYKVIDLHRQLVRFEKLGGAFTGAFGVARTSADFVPKTIISSAMIGLSLFIGIVGLFALALLDRLSVVEHPWYSAQREDQLRSKFNKKLLACTALIKMLTGIASLALAAFLEFENAQLALRQEYYRIVLDQLSAVLAIGSAIADLYAGYNKVHGTLNLKVSIALSTVAAVWSFKSVDNNAFPFYKMDINQYRVAVHTSQTTFATISPPQYAVVIIHGILIGLLALLALLSACTAILAANALRECIAKREELTELAMQNRFLALLNSFWAICLLVLALLGLAELPWNGDFIGADLLWLAVLVFGTGLLGSANKRISTLVKFVMNCITLSVCAEKCFLTINLVFQSVTHSDFLNPAVLDNRSRTGQIVLHSAQCVVMAGASLTALCGATIYGRTIRAREKPSEERGHRHHSMVLHCCCALSALFYALALLSSEVFFEIDKWRWSEVPLEQTAHHRIGNGLLGVTVFIVQMFCCHCPQLVTSSAILQLVLSSLAFFTLNSAITNVYYLQVLLNSRLAIGLNIAQRTLITLGICFASASALACALQVIFGTVVIFRSLHLLNHWREQQQRQIYSVVGRDGTAGISYLSYSSPSVADECHWMGNGGDGTLPGSAYQSPALHQIAIRPIEEQTLYWSAEDNPYIYKSTRRIYGQPTLLVTPNNRTTGAVTDESGYGASPSPTSNPANGGAERTRRDRRRQSTPKGGVRETKRHR
ncbi:hypothetical protein niasHT_036397 [Heterodera trifolii]|uniref:Uncharacterized protein n=1 Tax=Heterodera trifolii TaxID=157864 RepID=A0ABD2HYW2_9BILA